MASGCIITLNCPVCGEIVWEDEWDMVGDDILHETCRREYIKRKYHLSEEQFSRLYGAQILRAEIQALRQEAEEHKQWTERRAEELEKKLDALERSKAK